MQSSGPGLEACDIGLYDSDHVGVGILFMRCVLMQGIMNTLICEYRAFLHLVNGSSHSWKEIFILKDI